MGFYKILSLEDLENELWTDVIGFDGAYHCSNLGRIKSIGRFVNIRNGQRWVKERIRKQFLASDGRLNCPLSNVSINVAASIFLSFDNKSNYNIKKNCVMHKNKIQSDNRIENLVIKTISESHHVNFKKGLLNHLVAQNKKRTDDYNMIKERKCKLCNKTKIIKKFKRGCHTCKNCEYLKTNRCKSFKTSITPLVVENTMTNEIVNYENRLKLYNTKLITKHSFLKIIRSGQNEFKANGILYKIIKGIDNSKKPLH